MRILITCPCKARAACKLKKKNSKPERPHDLLSAKKFLEHKKMPPRKTAQAHDGPAGLVVAPPTDTHSSTSFLGATGESEASASSLRSGSLSASTPASSIIPFTEEPTGVQSGSVFPGTGVTVEVRPDQEEATRRELQERNRVLALAWIWGMLPGILAGAALTYSLWSVGTPITKPTEGSPKSPDTTTLTESHTTVLSASPTAPAPTTPATPATPPPTAPTLPTVPTTAPPAPVTEPPSPTTLLPPSITVPPVTTMVPTVSETVPTVPTTTETVTTTKTTTRTTTTKPTVPATQTTVPRETFYPGGPRLATEYLNVSLNWTIKPCEDFFGYVCGTFKGPYTSVLSNFTEGKNLLPELRCQTGPHPPKVGVYIKQATKAMLFTVDVPPRNQTPTEKAAGLFQACVQLAYNGTASEAAALRSFLRPVGLDVSNMAPDPNFVVWETMMRLSMEFGFPSLVEFGAVRRASQSKKLLTMEILASDEEWIKTSHMDHSAPDALANHYEKYLKFYDPKLNFTSLTSRIIAAEKSYGAFLGILRPSDTVSGIVVSITTLGRYTAPLITGADWVRMYEQLTNNTFRASDSVVLWDNATAVVVFASDNARLAREDARLLMAWNTLRRLVVYTSRVAMKRLQKEDVEDFCLSTVSSILEVAVTSRYVSTYTPRRALSAAKTLALRILSTVVDKMTNTPWIVPPVKNVTLRKATRMGLVMGYPKHLESASELEKFYASFPEVGAGFVRSYLETHRYLTSRIYSDNATDNFTTGVANAFYSGGTNAMTIQAGIVQPPMYFPDGTAALNYGGLGQVIGHEIMHAYDIEGIMRDDASRPAGFRTNASTLVEYERKVLCLRKSYEDYEKNARQLDDTIDSEGFADYSGLQLAYAAYRGLPASERDARVPDVPLSAEKTFFVAHCLKWCDLIQKRRQGHRYWAGRSRCVVPLQNMPEFSAAFGCRSGDLMNPSKRCDFW